MNEGTVKSDLHFMILINEFVYAEIIVSKFDILWNQSFVSTYFFQLIFTWIFWNDMLIQVLQSEEEVKEISCYCNAINEVPPAAEVSSGSIRYYRNGLIHQAIHLQCKT